MNIRKNVLALMILCNAIETKFHLLVFGWQTENGGGETGRKWNDLMEEGYKVDQAQDGTNKLTKTIDKTQMGRKYSWSCCNWCAETEQDFIVEDYVSSASRKIADIRMQMDWAFRQGVESTTYYEREMGYHCNAKDTKRTNRAIAYLSKEHTIYHGNGYKSVKRNWTLIQEEGAVEQQEIFEAQMLRLGEHDLDIRDFRSEGVVDFDDDYGSYASHIRGNNKTTKARYNGHHGYDW